MAIKIKACTHKFKRGKIGLALFDYYQNIRYKQKVSEEGVRKKLSLW